MTMGLSRAQTLPCHVMDVEQTGPNSVSNMQQFFHMLSPWWSRLSLLILYVHPDIANYDTDVATQCDVKAAASKMEPVKFNGSHVVQQILYRSLILYRGNTPDDLFDLSQSTSGCKYHQG